MVSSERAQATRRTTTNADRVRRRRGRRPLAGKCHVWRRSSSGPTPQPRSGVALIARNSSETRWTAFRHPNQRWCSRRGRRVINPPFTTLARIPPANSQSALCDLYQRINAKTKVRSKLRCVATPATRRTIPAGRHPSDFSALQTPPCAACSSPGPARIPLLRVRRRASSLFHSGLVPTRRSLLPSLADRNEVICHPLLEFGLRSLARLADEVA